jgi:hypothetical protein
MNQSTASIMISKRSFFIFLKKKIKHNGLFPSRQQPEGGTTRLNQQNQQEIEGKYNHH